MKSIEGLNPETNSQIFLLEFDPPTLYNKYSLSKKISTQRFYSPSGVLLLRNRLKDGKINFYFDYLGERNISIRDTIIKNRALKRSKFEIFLEGRKIVDILFQYGSDGQVKLSPRSKRIGINQISSFLKKIKGTSLENQLKEFAWAHSFMPENDATFAALFAGTLTGILSIPDQSFSGNIKVQAEDSPFWDYVECLEDSCADCGGEWVMSPIVECVFWPWDVTGRMLCYSICNLHENIFANVINFLCQTHKV
ncbi:MAG: hypothetical protein ACE5WD_13680 [Candidatus Aminicenantia bacterium]